MKLLLRLIWVAIAFAFSGTLGLVIAGAVAAERLNVLISRGFYGNANLDDIFERAHPFLDQSTALLWSVSILPPIALVILGEVMRIRSFTYYLAGGGIAVAALPALAAMNAGRATGTPFPVLLIETLAVAGFAAGAIYWLLAGRRA